MVVRNWFVGRHRMGYPASALNKQFMARSNLVNKIFKIIWKGLIAGLAYLLSLTAKGYFFAPSLLAASVVEIFIQNFSAGAIMA